MRLAPQSSVQSSRALSTGASRYGTLTQRTHPDTLASMLRRYRKDRNTTQILCLYAHIQQCKLETDALLGNLLVSALADVGYMRVAQEVFDALVCADGSSWNALITGYAKHGDLGQALAVYEKMRGDDDALHPSGCTYVALLKACSALKDIVTGRKIHAEIAEMGLLQSNVFVGSALIDLYGKCGSLEKAQRVFDRLRVRDVVSWTALIGAYAEHGCGEEALASYEEMRHNGICPNAVSFICSLKACACIKSIIKSQQMHSEIVVRGFESHLLVGSSLVDTYAKCASLVDAQDVFDKLPLHGVFSWTALLVGYTDHGHGDEALLCLRQMREEGVSPNAVTLMCGLKVCGNVGVAHIGQELHIEVARKGYEKELLICSTLVDMYAKCGLREEAPDMFNKLLVRDIVAWNALMAGYALLGDCESVCSAFNRMQGEDIKPNVTSLLSVLTGCCHAGLIDKGYYCFKSINNVFGLMPTVDHYTCMVDLLGRTGRLDIAMTMVENMPLLPGIVAWRTIVGACRKWGNLELGRHAYKHAVMLNVSGPSVYVSMSNLYVEADEEG